MKEYQIKAIEKTLKLNEKTRSICATIQHDEQNRQFIIDGFIAVVYNKFYPELDDFKKTDFNSSVKINNIIKPKDVCEKYELNDDDKLILSHLKEYGQFIKERYPESQYTIVYMFDRFFDCRLLRRFLDVAGNKMGKGINEIYSERALNGRNDTMPIEIFTDDYCGVCMPIYLSVESEQIRLQKVRTEFLGYLKGENIEPFACLHFDKKDGFYLVLDNAVKYNNTAQVIRFDGEYAYFKRGDREYLYPLSVDDLMFINNKKRQVA